MTVNEKLKKIVEEKGIKQSYLCERWVTTSFIFLFQRFLSRSF